MPFIPQKRRTWISEDTLGVPQPEDRCYVYYKEMIRKWKVYPSWTVAHHIYWDVKLNTEEGYDNQFAKELAWQVFFQLEVIPYELRQREKNGDVE